MSDAKQPGSPAGAPPAQAEPGPFGARADDATGSKTPLEPDPATRPVFKVDEEAPTGVDFGLLRAMYLKQEETRSTKDAELTVTKTAGGDDASDAEPEGTRKLNAELLRAEALRARDPEVTRAVESEATKSLEPVTRAPSEFPTRIVDTAEEELAPDDVLEDDDDEDRTIATEAPAHMDEPAAAPHAADDEPRTLAMDAAAHAASQQLAGGLVAPGPPPPPPQGLKQGPRVDPYSATFALAPEDVPRPPVPDYAAWGQPPPQQQQPPQPPPGGFFPSPPGGWPASQPHPASGPHPAGGPHAQAAPRYGSMPMIGAAPPPPLAYPPPRADGSNRAVVAIVLGCALAIAVGLALIISSLR